MKDFNILNKQKLLNKQILHQKFLINDSLPWLNINEKNLFSTYHQWMPINNPNEEILIFYSFIFKRIKLTTNNGIDIYQYSVNKDFFITNNSLETWLQIHNLWNNINEWDSNFKINKVILNNLPSHIGWTKNFITDIFIYYKENDPTQYQITKHCIYVYKIMDNIIQTEEDVTSNFLFLGSPLRNYLYLGIFTNDNNQKYLRYKYDPLLQNKKGINYFFTYNTISNPLFAGRGLIEDQKNKLSHIDFDKIWDIDFDLYNKNGKNDEKPLYYIPIYDKGFALCSDFFIEKENEYRYVIDDIKVGQFKIEKGDVTSTTNVYLRDNDSDIKSPNVDVRVY